jgi:chorismate synthase
VEIVSHVTTINSVSLPSGTTVSYNEAAAIPADAPLRCIDTAIQKEMMSVIDAAREAGDTVGGAFEVIVKGLPVGLGSHTQWDRKLDGRLGQAIMSIPAIKAVGLGIGPEVAFRAGSSVHDPILPPKSPGNPPIRSTNRAGGLEGGVSNGQELRITGFMKPIATLMEPLASIDLTTLNKAPATIERSDVCAVPAAAVVGEAMVALVLAQAFLEKFGGDSIIEIRKHFEGTNALLRDRLSPPKT